MNEQQDSAAQAAERWLEAVRSRGPGDALARAAAPEVVVERYHWAPPALAKRYSGQAEVGAWLAMSPARLVWSLEGPVQPGADGAWEVRYGVAVGDFFNTGLWRFWLDAEGRLLRLEHRPEDLPEAWRRGVPEGKRL